MPRSQRVRLNSADASPDVRGYALVSAALAPVLLIGGWTLAAARQTDGFDPVVQTISALAGLDAGDRWIMTGALIGVGICHITTARGLHGASTPGRVVLALGGLASLGVAATPITAYLTPPGHTLTAGTAFLALTAWPALGARRDGAMLLRPAAAVTATVGLGVLLLWFGAELGQESARVGLAERVAAGAQALWPLAAVLSARAFARRRFGTATRVT